MTRCFLLAGLLALCASALAQEQVAPFEAHMEEASGHMQFGRHADARMAYERALAAAATDAERAHARWGLSRAFEAQGDRQTALEVLKGALELHPERSPDPEEAARGIQWLTNCLERLAFLAGRMHDDGATLRSYERLIELLGADTPQAANATLALARAERDAGELDRAIARLDRMLATPTQSDWHDQARGMLAQILTKAGHHSRALELAREVPGAARTQTLILVADSLMAAAEYALAVEAAREVLDEVPGHQQAARMIYLSARRLGNVEALRSELQDEAAEGDAEVPIRLLALIAIWENDAEAAMPWYRRLARMHPGDAELLVELGRAALDARQDDVAEEALREALDLIPDHRGASLALAEVLAHQGKTDDAIALFRAGHNHDPRDLASVRSVIAALRRHSLHHSSIEVLEEAREAAADDTLLAYEMAGAFEDMLRYEEAAREYLKAMEAAEVHPRSAGHQLEVLAADEVAGSAVLDEIEAYIERSEPAAETRAALARVLLGAGRVERAVELLEGTEGAGAELAQIGREAELRGDNVVAMQMYQMARRLDPHSEQATEIALRIARLNHEAGDWRAALAMIDEVSTLDDHPEGLLMRARILQYDARRLEEARVAWQQLLAIGRGMPGYMSAARLGMADWLFAMGKLDEAERAYTELIADETEAPSAPRFELPPLPPGHSVPPQLLGDMMGMPLKDDTADRGWPLLRLAEIALRRGEADEAAERFHAVARKHPQSDHANDALGWLAFIRENFSGRHDTPEAYLRALGLRDRGEIAEAQLLLLEVAGTRGEPLADDALLLLGELRALAAEPQRAVETWLSLADRFPDSLLIPEALMRAAGIMESELGDLDGAADALRRVVDDHPNSAAAQEARSRLELLRRP